MKPHASATLQTADNDGSREGVPTTEAQEEARPQSLETARYERPERPTMKRTASPGFSLTRSSTDTPKR